MHRPLVALLALLLTAVATAQNETDDPADPPGPDETDGEAWYAQRAIHVGASLVAVVVLLAVFVGVARK